MQLGALPLLQPAACLTRDKPVRLLLPHPRRVPPPLHKLPHQVLGRVCLASHLRTHRAAQG